MGQPWDVLVVGARCAGSPLAMLLARRGYRVLVVDRTRFPSDTISSHIVQPRAVAALARWGLRDRLVATGCPPIRTFRYDFGGLELAGSPGTPDSPVAYCARRTVLDTLLVAAAREAGAEVREEVTVEELLVADGVVVGIAGRARDGGEVRERATIVVGADGWQSRVARWVGAGSYHERPPLSAAYYSYWADLPVGDWLEIHVRDRRGFGAAATHDGLTMVIGGWPYAEFEAHRSDVEGTFLRMLEAVPAFAERLRGARRVERFAGAPLPGYFRTPWGPGWALVGDAGYLKDSITAQGIADAFDDAERTAAAIDEHLGAGRPFADAMSAAQRARDAHALPMYEFTCQLATLEPPPPEMQRLLAAIAGSQQAMDGFARVNAGSLSPAEFFAPENVGAIFAAAGTGTATRPVAAG